MWESSPFNPYLKIMTYNKKRIHNKYYRIKWTSRRYGLWTGIVVAVMFVASTDWYVVAKASHAWIGACQKIVFRSTPVFRKLSTWSKDGIHFFGTYIERDKDFKQHWASETLTSEIYKVKISIPNTSRWKTDEFVAIEYTFKLLFPVHINIKEQWVYLIKEWIKL